MTFLLARDDVGDHAKWARHYDVPRIIHKSDVNEDTKDCEVQLEGEGPWTMGDNVDVEELEIIFTPGHTPGSLCLFHKPSKSMFTGLTENVPSLLHTVFFARDIGDHFLYSEKSKSFSMLLEYNKDDPKLQLESLLKLREYDFLRLIPGHQRRYEFSTVDEKNSVIEDFVSHMRQIL